MEKFNFLNAAEKKEHDNKINFKTFLKMIEEHLEIPNSSDFENLFEFIINDLCMDLYTNICHMKLNEISEMCQFINDLIFDLCSDGSKSSCPAM